MDEEEETNERESLRSKMEEMERRGKQRQKLLEQISVLLTEQNINPDDNQHESDENEEEPSPQLEGAPPQQYLDNVKASVTENLDIEEGAVGGISPPQEGALPTQQEEQPETNDVHVVNEPVEHKATDHPSLAPTFNVIKAQVMFPPTRPPMTLIGSSTPSLNLNNYNQITVKKPVAPRAPAQRSQEPVPQPKLTQPLQRPPWQYQVISSPVHVAYSRPVRSTAIPATAKPIPVSSLHLQAQPDIEPAPRHDPLSAFPGAPPQPSFAHSGSSSGQSSIAMNRHEPMAPPPPMAPTITSPPLMAPPLMTQAPIALAPIPPPLRAQPAMAPPLMAPPSVVPPATALAYTAPYEPPLYGAPKPTIPDFSTDSERDFANLKLALDNLLNPYVQLSEKYKFHVLLEHLKLPEAQMIAQSCRHHPEPYTAAMQALQLQYGQPHQLAQSEIAAILTSPDIKIGDSISFQSFSLKVHLLVSMLASLEGPQGYELNCCSHVDRLLSKLPKYLRESFIEFLYLKAS
ncbi:hypothetical protein WMY93_013068 [Mugilogobius chulae]|uniref:Uncharacterized protein n=1 Tax=Mugilogobius chulae TaxID=88201 RepID=A0AAW0P829_9GOBI